MDSSGNFLPVPATPSKDIAFHFGQDTVIPKSPTTPALRRKQSLRASNTVFDREVSKIWEETPVSPTHDPKLEAVTDSFGDVKLNEGEKRHFLSPKQNEVQFEKVMKLLRDWVNDILVDDNTNISSMREDFYDGIVFKKILAKLSGQPLNLPLGDEVQAKERQKKNLAAVLDKIAQVLRLSEDLIPWSLDSVFEQNLLDNVQILLALIHHFNPEDKILLLLPKVLTVNVIQIQLKNGRIERLDKPLTLFKNSGKKDDFDSLIDGAPEKLHHVKRNLLQFANSLLCKLSIQVENLQQDFANGINFILLIGLIEGFFVPLHEYHYQDADTDEKKLHNVSLALDLLEEMGLKVRNHPVEIVQGEMKPIMRILYYLYISHNSKAFQSLP